MPSRSSTSSSATITRVPRWASATGRVSRSELGWPGAVNRCDVLIHAYASYAMSQRLPNGKIILYSDAGHGVLFQHHEELAREVLDFLH